MSKAFIEGVKQFVRTILAAVLPLIIVGIQNGSVDVKVVATAAVMALLMGIDKWVHEDPGIKAEGIFPTFKGGEK